MVVVLVVVLGFWVCPCWAPSGIDGKAAMKVEVLHVLRPKVEENNQVPQLVVQNNPEHHHHAVHHAPGYHADLEPHP